jgi:acyl-CoA dehydrogenase
VNDEAFLITSVEKIFLDLCSPEAVMASETEWPVPMWAGLEDAGLTLASIPEERGGSGGSLREALALLQVAGRFACPLPLAETALLAGWILSEAGLPLLAGPLTLASGTSIRFEPTVSGRLVSGTAMRVPWGRLAHIVVVGAEGDDVLVTLVEPSECLIQEGSNLAAEPRDTVRFRVEVDPARVGSVPMDCLRLLRLRGAMARTMMMAGALGRVLELSILHSADRIQFGRPIGKFQAIQHYLAIMAGEVATATAAAEALIAASRETDLDVLVAAAKTRAGEAATVVSALAHQIHGAIGVTREHHLQLFTRRLLAWRDDYGSEFEWAGELGRSLAIRGSQEIWPILTSFP